MRWVCLLLHQLRWKGGSAAMDIQQMVGNGCTWSELEIIKFRYLVIVIFSFGFQKMVFTITDDSTIEGFCRWMLLNRIKHSKCKIELHDGMGRRVVATSSIEEGEVVVEVPDDQVLWKETSPICEILEELQENHRSFGGNLTGPFGCPYWSTAHNWSDTKIEAMALSNILSCKRCPWNRI